ncbi:glutamate-rich protein 1 isoform X2 [Lissotriton helveticus]
MSNRRQEVFKQNVLKKLYPEGLPIPPASIPNVHSETSPGNTDLQQNDSEKAWTSADSARLTGLEINASSQQKVYTASLPPADFAVVSSVDNMATESENTDSDDTDGSDDSPRNFKRRHTRKRRKNLTLQCPKYPSPEHTHLLNEEQPIQTGKCTKISKNKKRKLKKKRQKEKMKAAGLLLKATCGDFVYQPEGDKNKIADNEDMDNKMNEILDFLQATKEIYVAESRLPSNASLGAKNVSPRGKSLPLMTGVQEVTGRSPGNDGAYPECRSQEKIKMRNSGPAGAQVRDSVLTRLSIK